MNPNGNFIVILSHGPNPDIHGGYWNAPVDDGAPVRKKASSLLECAKLCRAYCERNGLGGGNWTGGEIRRDGEPVAHVSYNGRVWNRKPGDPLDFRWTMATEELNPISGEIIPVEVKA